MNITEELIAFLYVPLGIIIIIILFNVLSDSSYKNNNLKSNFWKKNINNWISKRPTFK